MQYFNHFYIYNNLFKFELKFLLLYVGYGAWLSILGSEQWDDGNNINGDDWKKIGSGLRSGSPSSFWICSSSVSPCFEELELFLLELEQSRSGPDRSRSVCQKWEIESKKEQKDETAEAIRDNQHIRIHILYFMN